VARRPPCRSRTELRRPQRVHIKIARDLPLRKGVDRAWGQDSSRYCVVHNGVELTGSASARSTSRREDAWSGEVRWERCVRRRRKLLLIDFASRKLGARGRICGWRTAVGSSTVVRMRGTAVTSLPRFEEIWWRFCLAWGAAGLVTCGGFILPVDCVWSMDRPTGFLRALFSCYMFIAWFIRNRCVIIQVLTCNLQTPLKWPPSVGK
jgi:hypothetical protein